MDRKGGWLAGVAEWSSVWLAGGWLAASGIVVFLWLVGYDPESYTYLRGLAYRDLTEGLLEVALAAFAGAVLVSIDRRVGAQAEATLGQGETLREHTLAVVKLLEATERLVAEVEILGASGGVSSRDEDDGDDDLGLLGDDDFWGDDEDDDEDDDIYLDADDLDDEVVAVPDHGKEGQSPIRTSY